MLEILKILNPLYKHTYGRIDINISTMIYIIKKRAYTLKLKRFEFIQISQILDLFTAMNILLDEVYLVDYYIYREINKCLTLVNTFLMIHEKINLYKHKNVEVKV
jgi:hypothetical protein